MQIEHIASTAGLHTEGAKHNASTVRTADAVNADKMMEPIKADEVIISKTGLSISEFEKTLESLREYTGWGNFNIDFATDDETGSVIIRIIDRESGETLRQIPPDQILALRSHLREVLSSVFDYMA